MYGQHTKNVLKELVNSEESNTMQGLENNFSLVLRDWDVFSLEKRWAGGQDTQSIYRYVKGMFSRGESINTISKRRQKQCGNG